MSTTSTVVSDWIKRLESLIDDAESIISGAKTSNVSSEFLSGTMPVTTYDHIGTHQYYLRGCSLLANVYKDSSHPIRESYERNNPNLGLESLRYSKAALEEAKAELENNWHIDPRSILAAEIFSDHVEMAEHLLEKKWKDPAAVIIGTTLELHLKELSKKHRLPVLNNSGKPMKASSLNDQLAKNTIYNSSDQKAVTGWLGIRNDAAHGNYSNYTIDLVKVMKDAVLNFMVRNPF